MMSRRIPLAPIGVLMLVAAGVGILMNPPAVGAAAIGIGSGGTIIVGASSDGSSGGSPGTGGSGTEAGGPGGQESGPPACTYTELLLNDEGGFAPGGPTPGSWYSVTCINQATGAESTQTVWIADQQAQTTPPVDPHALAVEALKSLVLPSPVSHFNPAGASVVNLSTWLWIDSALWHPLSVTASAGPVSATAVATPVSVTWSMGDGKSTICEGPGQPFTVAESEARKAPSCSYIYRTSSAGQWSPDGNPDQAAYPVRAVVTWAVSWTAQGAVGGGELPTMYTSTLSRVRVEQVESINAEGAQAVESVPASRHLSA